MAPVHGVDVLAHVGIGPRGRDQEGLHRRSLARQLVLKNRAGSRWRVGSNPWKTRRMGWVWLLNETAPDPRPRAKIKDPELLRSLHLVWRECALCGVTEPRSLHHISKHPRDDVTGNLVMLCGTGTTGCHGLVEARDPETVWALGVYIRVSRGDVLSYLYATKGVEPAKEWMRQHLLID